MASYSLVVKTVDSDLDHPGSIPTGTLWWHQEGHPAELHQCCKENFLHYYIYRWHVQAAGDIKRCCLMLYYIKGNMELSFGHMLTLY